MQKPDSMARGLILTVAFLGVIILAILPPQEITLGHAITAVLLLAASWWLRRRSHPPVIIALGLGILCVTMLGRWLHGWNLTPGTLYRWIAGLGFMGAISGLITKEGAERLARKFPWSPWIHALIQDIWTSGAIMAEAFPSRVSATRLRMQQATYRERIPLLLASTMDFSLRRTEAAGESRALRTGRSLGLNEPVAIQTPAVELQRICVEIGGIRILSNIQLELGQGEWLALLGPSGSGKTTLLRVIAGLEGASSGTLKRLGSKLNMGCSREVMMTFQNPEHFLLGATPWEDASIGTKMTEAELRDLFHTFSLGSEMHRGVSSLSFGQQKRAMLVSALATAPRILLCDELTSGLDAETGALVVTRLEALCDARPLSILWCTHDMAAIPTRIRNAFVLGSEPCLSALSSPEISRFLKPNVRMPFHHFPA
jgi:sulfate transport system ATP-binding protein